MKPYAFAFIVCNSGQAALEVTTDKASKTISVYRHMFSIFITLLKATIAFPKSTNTGILKKQNCHRKLRKYFSRCLRKYYPFNFFDKVESILTGL